MKKFHSLTSASSTIELLEIYAGPSQTTSRSVNTSATPDKASIRAVSVELFQEFRRSHQQSI